MLANDTVFMSNIINNINKAVKVQPCLYLNYYYHISL